MPKYIMSERAEAVSHAVQYADELETIYMKKNADSNPETRKLTEGLMRARHIDRGTD